MPDKLKLEDITSGYSSTSVINGNFEKIEEIIDTLLSRSGAQPNTMESSLDMNSHRVMNLPDAASEREPVTLSQFQAGVYDITEFAVSQESLGRELSPISSEELAAGLDESDINFRYTRVGDARRYKILMDGSTSTANDEAIRNWIRVGQQAVTMWHSGGVVAIDDATVWRSNIDSMVITQPLQIRGVKGSSVIRGEGSAIADHIFITLAAELDCADIEFQDFYMAVQIYGERLTRNVDTIRFNNVRSTNCDYLFSQYEVRPFITPYSVQDIFVTDCTIAKSPASWDIESYAINIPGVVGRIQIEGNIFRGIRGTPVRVGTPFNQKYYESAMGRASIRGNVFEDIRGVDDGQRVAAIEAYGYEVIVTDNVIKNVSHDAGLFGSGIYLETKYAIVSENLIVDAADGGAAIEQGGDYFGFTPTRPTTDYVKIHDNLIVFTSNKTDMGGIKAIGGATVESNTVVGATGFSYDYALPADRILSANNVARKCRRDVAFRVSLSSYSHFRSSGDSAIDILGDTNSVASSDGYVLYTQDSTGTAGTTSVEISGFTFILGQNLVPIVASAISIGRGSANQAPIDNLVIEECTAIGEKNGASLYGLNVTANGSAALKGTGWRVRNNDFTGIGNTQPIAVNGDFPNDAIFYANNGADAVTLTNPGAVPLTASTINIETYGTAPTQVFSIPDATEGKRLTIVASVVTAGTTARIQPDTGNGYAWKNLNASGNSISLIFTNGSWSVTSIFYGT